MYNIKNKTILSIIILLLSTIFTISVFAGAYDKKSSGIKQQFYFVKWCPAHKEITGNGSIDGCIKTRLSGTGAFNSMGTKLKNPLTSNGTGTTVKDTIGFTKTSTSLDTLDMSNSIAFFEDGSTDFEIKGEGIFTITIVLVDNAGNASKNEIVYKIDKTAPKMWLSNIIENTDFTYKTRTIKKSGNFVQKFDSTIKTQPDIDLNSELDSVRNEAYKTPAVSNYEGDGPQIRKSEKHNLHTIYFSGKDETIFPLPLFSDHFLEKLNKNNVSAGTGGLFKKAELIKITNEQTGSGTRIISDLFKTGFNNVKVSDLKLNKNTQGLYKIRLYDNSCDLSGNNCNYVETAFYAVRDNVAPNVVKNDINNNDAIKKLLLFDDDSSSYDEDTIGHNKENENKAFSKFIVATKNRALKYVLDDTGLGKANVSGTDNDKYALYNAGISTGATVYIENTDAPVTESNKVVTKLFSFTGARFYQSRIVTKDFSKVDNDREDAGYRKYSSKYVTQGDFDEYNGLCDLVGNCLEPQMTYRVIAGNVDTNLTTIAYSGSENKVIADTTTKAIADTKTKYNLSLQLRDEFGNIVIPVTSNENNNNPLVRDVSTKLSFENGLFSDLRTTAGNGNRLAVVSIVNNNGDTITTNNINNDNNSNIVLTESANNKQDGQYTIKIGSEVPTHMMYPYISTGAVLKLTGIDFDNYANKNNINSDLGYKLYDELNDTKITFKDKTYNGNFNSSTGYINNIGINPREADYSFDLNYFSGSTYYDEYGKISGGITTVTGLTSVVKNINFEFASPIIYGLKGFSLLVDGQYNPHTKKIFEFGDGVTAFNIFEKILVSTGSIDTNPKDNHLFDYFIRKEGLNSININPGLYTNNNIISSSNDKGIFGQGNIKDFIINNNNLKSSNGVNVEIQQSTISGVVYDNENLKSGFVSALKYKTNKDKMVYLPALARNIDSTKFSNDIEKQYQMARKYFDGEYSLGTGSLSLNNFVTDIGITGLSYTGKDDLTTDTTHDKGAIDIKTAGGKLTRYDLFKTFKANVAKYSGGKVWCTNLSGNIDITKNNELNKCTTTINGEKVSFVKGDLTIKCGDTCSITDKRSIIVKDGKIILKSNITTLNSNGKNTKGSLLLGVITENGLSNLTKEIKDDTKISDIKTNGWMLIDSNVTNIDAELVVQGPVISVDSDDKFFTKNNLTGTKLINQLYIYGSILSLNNIGGARKANPIVPYIITGKYEDDELKNISQIFDLNYLRRFALINKSYYTKKPSDDGISVPYHPDGINKAKRSGRDADGSESSGNLRPIPDKYKALPLLIDKNRKTISNPSIFTISN